MSLFKFSFTPVTTRFSCPRSLSLCQVLLSEIYADPGVSRVVVQELKANASAKEQNDFLQQGDPYRWAFGWIEDIHTTLRASILKKKTQRD